MTELFLNVVNQSISASWLVLAVLLLRILLRRSPRWINVLLWGIVAVRLIWPFSIESTLSLIPSTQTIPAEIMQDWSPQIQTGIPVLNDAVNPVIAEAFTPDLSISALPLQFLIPLWSKIWLAGIAVLLIYTIVSWWVLRRKLATAVILRNNVYQSEYIRTPFVLGIFKPTIYLPYTLSKEDIIHVISHEKAHIRRHDHWWKPLGFVLLTIHWFNPVMWLGYILFCRDVELACDECVIQNLDSECRAEYARALLACSRKSAGLSVCPLAFGEVGVKMRIRSVMNYRKPTFWVILLALILCTAMAVCFLTDPVEAYPQPTETAESTVQTEIVAESGESAAIHESLSDLSYFLELAFPEKEFQYMEQEWTKEVLSEYRDLLDSFILLSRQSIDGSVCYIAGCFKGDPKDNPFYGMYEYSSGSVDRALITADVQDAPDQWYIIEHSDIHYSPESGLILILPTQDHTQKDGYAFSISTPSGWKLTEVFNRYLLPNGRAYLLDAASRGIALVPPAGPYLEVYLISETWGQITEYIPLTQEQAMGILSEERIQLDAGHDFAAILQNGTDSTLEWEEEAGHFTTFLGVPQTVLDLAAEKCGYRLASPRDLTGSILEARLDCDWLEQPLYASEGDLQRLQAILVGAQYGYVGNCGYGARLTLQLSDGSTMVLFKATDDCDSLVFGSYGGYFIGDTENQEFWSIFGLDPATKELRN